MGGCYLAFVWVDRYQDWECYGHFPSYVEALHECERIMSVDEDARDFEIRVKPIKYDIDNNACFKENLADSMDQSCPGEIHIKGFPADDPEAKREYEKAAKDFCIDNLSCFDK
ncbi:hypothetical protein ACRRGD_001935 [Escherichia coli]